MLHDIKTQIIKIGELRLQGTSRDWISKNLRAQPVHGRDYSALFRIIDNIVYIVRIVHQRQDLTLMEFEAISDINSTDKS